MTQQLGLITRAVCRGAVVAVCWWCGDLATAQEGAAPDQAPASSRVLAEGELFAPVLEVQIEPVLTGLHNPFAVAIRPGGAENHYEVYVSESGALRVLRMWNDQPGTASHVVTGFAPARYNEAAPYRVGPLGLLFLDHDRLVVVDCGAAANSEGAVAGSAAVSLFELPDDAAPLATDQAAEVVRQEVPAGEPAPARWHSIARTRRNDFVPDLLVISSRGQDPQGWLLKIPVQAEGLGPVEPYIPSQERTGLAAPAGLTVSPKGYIVVGQAGSSGDAADSLLSFYNPIDGAILLNLAAGLRDMTSLAYSPSSGNLYAVDSSASAPTRGGLYRIDDASRPGAPASVAVQVAAVLRPTAMAFGPDGALYVTALGDTDGSATGAGVLLRITGEL